MSVVIAVLFGVALLPYASFFGIAVYLFLAPCYDKLSARTFIEFFQKIDPYMRVRAPLLSLAQVGLTLPLLALVPDRWTGLPFWLTFAALVLAMAGMALAVFGNVPLNRQLERFSPDTPPAGWEQVRDRWLRYHDLRGTLGILGFVLLLVAALGSGYSGKPGDARTGTVAERPAPRRWEATVYLPLADNQGQEFSEAAWEKALEGLVAPFGGATLGPPQEGCWFDARRRVCRERVRPVIVSFAPGRLDEFRRAIHKIGKRLGQEAMYVRFEEPRVQLIHVGEADPGADR